MTPKNTKKERRPRAERERTKSESAQRSAAPGAGAEARRWTAIVFCAALLVRVINGLFMLNGQNPFFDPTKLGTSVDMWENHIQALEILRNGGFPNGVFLHSPLYPHFIAAIYLFDYGNYYFVYWIQLAAGAAMCALLYLCGRNFFEERAARLGALAAALYSPLLFNDIIFQSDSVTPIAIVGLLILAVRYQRARDRPLRRAAWVGLLLGVIVGFRPPLALLGPALAVWILWAARDKPLRSRLAAIAIIGFISLAMVAPYSYHNTKVSGKLTLTQGQMDLTRGLCFGAESTGYFNYPEGSPKPPLLKIPSAAFFKLQLAKIRFLCSWFEFPDLYDFYILGRLSPLIRYNPLTFRVAGPLALLGLLLGLGQFRKLSLLYATLFVQAFSVVVFYVSSRFRAPMTPLLLLFAASAVFWLADAFRRGRNKGKAWAAAGALAVLALFVNSLDASRLHSQWYSDTMAGNGFLNRAGMAAQEGNYPRAIEAAERILWIKYPQYQLLGRAVLVEIYNRMGLSAEAERHKAIAVRLDAVLKTQPSVDYHGNTYFPPTDRFGSIDPFEHPAPPADLLGFTASVYPPRPGAKKVPPVGMPRLGENPE